ncbi:hypothetical protein M8848_07385 [Pasteurella multocida]|uniref:hypothetical protein n=1 Tax=Pasteurella multocida TaxID=747 RepID=UPI0020231D28|nr:hypothetical protein [Pasteurella multocida]URH77498.1 hypothetical protein M8848_07385 [Pasteurella multocida]URH79672.1 hypothetical protein M8846_07430 [Pasteurella multocida]URH81746.1 hypothetical protein M8847_07350 [Pasteurella multocida]WND41390.1 hypothetical protein RHO09_07330 [Pasteurella multocida]WND43451.1 hypothetical protein RHO08_07425 [Pasteurella multocida]
MTRKSIKDFECLDAFYNRININSIKTRKLEKFAKKNKISLYEKIPGLVIEKEISKAFQNIDGVLIKLICDIVELDLTGDNLRCHQKATEMLLQVKRALVLLNDFKNKNKSIVAKQNRAKRKPKPEDPNINSARILAKEIWGKYRKKSLLDTAYEIKSELGIRKSVGLIQEWIRDLNPNRKKHQNNH